MLTIISISLLLKRASSSFCANKNGATPIDGQVPADFALVLSVGLAGPLSVGVALALLAFCSIVMPSAGLEPWRAPDFCRLSSTKRCKGEQLWLGGFERFDRRCERTIAFPSMCQLGLDPSFRLVDRREEGGRWTGRLGNETGLEKPASLMRSMDRRQPDDQCQQPVLFENQPAFDIVTLAQQHRFKVQMAGSSGRYVEIPAIEITSNLQRCPIMNSQPPQAQGN